MKILFTFLLAVTMWGGTPTITPGAVCGAGCTATGVGTDKEGTVTVTVFAGATPVPGNPMFTLTFGFAFENDAVCVISPANDFAQGQTGPLGVTTGSKTFVSFIALGSMSIPGSGSFSYKWNYICRG